MVLVVVVVIVVVVVVVVIVVFVVAGAGAGAGGARATCRLHATITCRSGSECKHVCERPPLQLHPLLYRLAAKQQLQLQALGMYGLYFCTELQTLTLGYMNRNGNEWL